jgi:hypothetical protein
MPSPKDGFGSFLISDTKVFSPKIYGISSAVARSRIALTAKAYSNLQQLKAEKTFTFPQCDT